MVLFQGKALEQSSEERESSVVSSPPFSDRGRRGSATRLHGAPALSRTRRWRPLWGGCHTWPCCGCRCRWGRATTCARPPSRPRTTGWRRSVLPECPEDRQTHHSQSLCCCFLLVCLQWMDVSPSPAPGPGWTPLQAWWGAMVTGWPLTPSPPRPGTPPTGRPASTTSHTRGATCHRPETEAASRPGVVRRREDGETQLGTIPSRKETRRV